jgi:transcriptional regulator with XRE-family HTH domain
MRSRTFSERLQTILAQRGMTQKELSDRIFIAPSTVTRWFTGGSTPQPRTIEAIANAIGVRKEWLLTGEGEPNAPRIFDDAGSYGSDPRSILKRAREAKNWTPEQLENESGVPAQYIRDIESGAVQGTNEKQLRKLAKALELDADALMQGSDHPPIVGAGRTFGADPNVHTTAGIEARTIPLISMAQAGHMTKASFDDVYDHEGVIDYAKRGRKTFAVRIRGDSMEPVYPEGTIAIVEPEKQPQNERLVLTKMRSGDVLFKRLQFDGELFRLISTNPLYRPIEARQQDIEWMYPVVRTQTEED